MIYKVIVTAEVINDFKKHSKAGNKQLIEKISQFIDELAEHPRSGTGKPEQLKGYITERWSRKIDSKHRLIYEIYDDKLVVFAVSAYSHYGDK